MIIKAFEEKKIDPSNQKIYLMYGENEELKYEIIERIFLKIFEKKVFRYDESEILTNEEIFYNHLSSGSFFEEKKLIIINNVSDKFEGIVNEIINKNLDDINIILISSNLSTKSKLRKIFEKNNNLICIPFYKDTHQSLYKIIEKFLIENNISLPREIINYIIEKSQLNRRNIKNELEKIKNFSVIKKNIRISEIKKLINLYDDYEITELVDQFLLNNKKKILNILNTNTKNYDNQMVILRTFLLRLKRLIKIYEELENEKNIDKVLIKFKPPIFWKDKEILKNQIKMLSTKKVYDLLKKINLLELKIKKNINLSNFLLEDFFIQNIK